MKLPPKEGVGNAGCPLHPRPRVHLVVVERTRVTTSTPESPGVPARNGFNGFLRALPGDRALLPPSPTDMFLSKPGWADSNSANLTPASGRQDHTTSPYAATSFVSSPFDRSRAFRQPALQPRCAPDAAASTASAPRVRDDRDTPLVSAKSARMCERAVLTNRPSLELSPLRPKGDRACLRARDSPVSSSTRTVARASSPHRARKGVDDGTS